MTKSKAKKWSEALRSGKYKQTREGYLRNGEYYCCVGVLCEINGEPTMEEANTFMGWPNRSRQPETRKEVPKKLFGQELALLNDSGFIDPDGTPKRIELSFNEIADLIELIHVHNAENRP